MTARRIVVLCAALVVLCFALGSLSDDAYAQRSSASREDGSEALVNRKGLAKGNPNEGKGEPPKPWQMTVGIGSVVVMIIVVKWL